MGDANLINACCTENPFLNTVHRLLAVCLRTGPYPLPKPFLHTVRSSAFSLLDPIFSLRLFSSCLYRGADKSLDRPEKKATVTEDFDVHISCL